MGSPYLVFDGKQLLCQLDSRIEAEEAIYYFKAAGYKPRLKVKQRSFSVCIREAIFILIQIGIIVSFVISGSDWRDIINGREHV